MAELRMFRGTGRIPLASGAAAAALEGRAALWGVPLHRGPEGMALAVWGADLRLSMQGPEWRIEIAAPEDRLVGVLREAATEAFAEAGLPVEWDALAVGALAPGLSLMRVASVSDCGPNYLRVRLQGADAARFAQGGLHFRLLLPPPGRAACWPRVAPSGRTLWPEGPDALHRPVYTIAAQGGDWLDFVIFRHEGSPTCDWAGGLPLGMQVGVLGPGGGICPTAGALHLYGDQTALPAILRLLDLAPGRARATLRCAPEDLAALSRLTGRAAHGIRVTDDLLGALKATPLPEGPEDHVWFAAGSDEARAARRWLRDRGRAAGSFTAAAYW